MARDFNRCISALNAAAGREMSADEIGVLFDRLHKAALDIKADRPNPGGLPRKIRSPVDYSKAVSMDGLFRDAAREEAAKMIEEAELKAQRAVADVGIAVARQNEIGAMKASGLSDVEAVRRLLVNAPDGKADEFSLESRYKGISQFAKSKIQDTWAALGNGVWDYFQRADKVKLLVQEMHGVDTGDAIAKKGAAAWLNTAEEFRLWFNEKGGKVGHLEDWGLPQHHAQDLVARAAGGTDPQANQKAWVDFIFPLLNRDKYTDQAGRQMSEGEVRDFLAAAWETIATGGASKKTAGKSGGVGARSNRHAEERQIHFKDADANMAYWERFGDRTVPDILMGHLDSMAKDIAFVEHFGSNPDGMFRLLRDEAEIAAKKAAPQDAGKVDKELANLDRLYDYAAGKSKPVADMRVARGFEVLHNLNTAGKLGSAMWASLIGDKVMFEAIARVNNLPAMQTWWNEIRLLNPLNTGERAQLRRHAIMLDYMQQAMVRYGDELGKTSFTGKLANTVMQVSGMSAVNEWRRGAWALSAMDTLGNMVSTKRYDEIGPQDMRMLSSYGITPDDWAVWKLAKPSDLGHGNDKALTAEAVGNITDAELRAAGIDGDPNAIRRDATVKLLGALTSESHVALIEPGWSERAMMYGGLQRGDVRDELTRSFWQFKAFPITQFSRMMDIAMSRPTLGGKIGFTAMFPVMLTMAGAMMIQVQEILNGRDPRPMFTDDGLPSWKFWGASFLKGGSLGLYGDFLFSQTGTTRMGSGPLEAVAGPTIGAVADIATFIGEAKGAAERGEPSHAAAKALAIAKGFVPFQNFWATKAATDHLIFQNAQDALNPGYLAATRAKTRREFGNDSWWLPGQALPERAPDLGQAFRGAK